MPVNRIYFRGLKTFQRVFAILGFFTIQYGCAASEPIRVESVLVAQSPHIVDLKVHGACSVAHVFVRFVDDQQASIVAPCRELPVKQAGNPVFQTRVSTGLESKEHDGPLGTLEVVIECQVHQNQTHLYEIVKDDHQDAVTPDWAKGLVWYQVFPERFRDGNPNNNPSNWDLTPKAWNSSFSNSTIEEVERSWNRRLVNPRQFPVDNHRDGGSVATTVFARRYGGDLIGVYNQLESLSEQGYTGIYLCPIFQSRSLHKYDADDHRHIDPTLGHPGKYSDVGPGHTKLKVNENPADETTWQWTVADEWFVDEFLPKAKSLGLRVVLDGVWNHVGTDHFAFSDVVEYGNQSQFVDWFDVEFDEAGELLAWKSWGSVNGNLPVFRQTVKGDLSAGPKAHIMAVTRRWMDPNGDGDPSDGIDGWRLDVAGEIGKGFWKNWRAEVRSVYPEALIIAEIWSDADSMLHDEAFDGQMNYPFAYAVADWLSIGNAKHDAKVCASRLQAVFHHAPEHDLVQFNLMTSHDTERLASMMHNDFQRNYDNGASRWESGTGYDSEAVDADDMDRSLAAIAVMVASPGSMMIYNGDEYALPGADDPDNRRPIPWNELGIADPLSESNPNVRFNQAVNELIGMRSEPGMSELLRFGDAEFIGNADGSLIIRRQLNDRRVDFLIHSRDSTTGDMTWGARDQCWVIESERSRKIQLKGGMLAVHVRLMIEKKSRNE